MPDRNKRAFALLLLVLLAGCAYYHVVEEGDTLYRLSREYGVSVQEIQRANPGIDPYNLQIGQRVNIPRFPDQRVSDYSGRRLDTPTPPVAGTPRLRATPTPGATATPRPTQGRARFVWPIEGGAIVRRFGDSSGGVIAHGLDIEAPAGTPIRAADAGRVIYAADKYKGYGLMVIILHDGNFVTIYAHNRANHVKKDDQVERGQLIAEVGQTGRVDSPTLHFEIRIGSRAVDPLQYLPDR